MKNKLKSSNWLSSWTYGVFIQLAFCTLFGWSARWFFTAFAETIACNADGCIELLSRDLVMSIAASILFFGTTFILPIEVTKLWKAHSRGEIDENFYDHFGPICFWTIALIASFWTFMIVMFSFAAG
jgi:hypothetical protein